VISFIVPAYNEEALLGRTVDALHGAARVVGEPYEIIVADDDSSDDTAAVAQAHGAVLARVKHRQIAATRNAGALRAVGGGAAFRFDGRVPLYGRAMQFVM